MRQSPALTIHHATGFGARMLGLLARPPLTGDEVLYLVPCSSVHTVGMRYRIDVAFVDRQGQVLKVVENLRPLRAAWCPGAHGAVELVGGGARRHGVQRGSRLPIGVDAGAHA